MVRAIEDDAGVLIFDDTIQEKPYSDENELISWHFDHSKNRTVKDINLLNCVSRSRRYPAVTYNLLGKPVVYRDAKTGAWKRKSNLSKNEHLRRMLAVCQRNQAAYRYVLADSWFFSQRELALHPPPQGCVTSLTTIGADQCSWPVRRWR